MKYENIRERWGQYVKWHMNDENTEIETEEDVTNQGMTNNICEKDAPVNRKTNSGTCLAEASRIYHLWIEKEQLKSTERVRKILS